MNLDDLMKETRSMYESWIKDNGGINSDQLQADFLKYIKINLGAHLKDVCILTITEYNTINN